MKNSLMGLIGLDKKEIKKLTNIEMDNTHLLTMNFVIFYLRNNATLYRGIS